MAKVTRSDRLAAARAAGRAGQDPPEWMTESDEVDAYEQGYQLHQARRGRSQSRRSSGKAKTPGAPRSGGSGQSEPSQPAPPSNPVPPPSARVISMPSDTAHDLAGVLVGVVAVAFLINVLHGTWQQWLRAKFLNDSGALPKPSTPATGQTPPSYPVQQGATADWSFLNPGQVFTPTAPAAPSQGSGS